MAETLIKTFTQISKADTEIAGGKGASLGEMTQAGIPVPGGFVILSNAFDRFIEETDLNVEIDAVLHEVNIKEIHTVENASEKIRAMILSRKMPENIRTEILKFYKKLDCKFVAVRSSATSEDSASAAWAGQLESYLNTKEKTLLENVKKCWASLFTPRAIFYRFEKNLSKNKISVAVVVQKMVDSEESGIAFSVHPVTQDENQIIIEAGVGLGEAIVSGSITPDSYLIDKQGFNILDINVNEQTKALYKKPKGGNEWKELGEKGKKQVLTEKEIIELSKLIVKIENHYGFPCDIEWAKEKNKFYIVQSRPITTLKDKIKIEEKKEIPKKPKFSKKFEGLFSLFGIQALAVKKINDYTKQPLLLDDIYFFKEGYLVVYIYQEDIDRIRSFILKELKNNADYLGDLYNNTVKRFESFVSGYDKFKKEIENANTPNQLKSWIGGFINLTSDINAPAYLAEMFAGYDDFWMKYLGLSKEDFDMLMTPEESSFSKEFSQELAKMKLRKSNKTPKELASEFFWMLNNYNMVDLVTPDYIIQELSKMSEAEAKKIKEETKTYIVDVLEKKKAILKKIRLDKSKAKILKSLSSFIVLQDKRKEIVAKTNSLFMKSCDKLFDMYKISNDERKKILAASFPTWFSEIDIKNLIADSEKAYICHYYPVVGKPLIGSDALKVLKEIESYTETKQDVSIIVGKTAFGGYVKGKVRKLMKSEDFSKFKEGEVLVAHMTSPEFVPTMKKASAVITDEGGITCHAAIVSRELKKPCIIGTKIATQVLNDGDEVEVDANQGIVIILEKAKQ